MNRTGTERARSDPEIGGPFVLSLPTPRAVADEAMLLQARIDALDDEIAILDDDWMILAVNEAWTASAAREDLRDLRPGGNCLRLCELHAMECNPEAQAMLDAMRKPRPGRVSASRSSPVGWLCASDVGKLKTLSRRRQRGKGRPDAPGRLLREALNRLQAEERMRIEQRLHDGVAQLLVVLHLCSFRLKQLHGDDATRSILADADETIALMNQALRTASRA